MKLFIYDGKIAAVLLVAAACSALPQYPAGFSYDPYSYFPYTAVQHPGQDAVQVAPAPVDSSVNYVPVNPVQPGVVESPEIQNRLFLPFLFPGLNLNGIFRPLVIRPGGNGVILIGWENCQVAGGLLNSSVSTL